MNSRPNNINDFLKGHKILGLDDTFEFKCTECGKCCKHREDILLNPKDVFNMSKALDIIPVELITQYCEVYIGNDSKVPIVRILPRGNVQRCPFLSANKCIVHNAKPTICAMFPIGRCAMLEDNGKFKVQYLLPEIDCGERDKSHTNIHTVRDWLKSFNISEEDEFFLVWTDRLSKMSNMFRTLEKTMSAHTLGMLADVVYVAEYCNYDMDSDIPFLNQFNENMQNLDKLLNELGLASMNN